jgi:hypothetical protein
MQQASIASIRKVTRLKSRVFVKENVIYCLPCYLTNYPPWHIRHECLGLTCEMPASTMTTYGQFYKACRPFPDDWWIHILEVLTANDARFQALFKVQLSTLAQSIPMYPIA